MWGCDSNDRLNLTNDEAMNTSYLYAKSGENRATGVEGVASLVRWTDKKKQVKNLLSIYVIIFE